MENYQQHRSIYELARRATRHLYTKINVDIRHYLISQHFTIISNHYATLRGHACQGHTGLPLFVAVYQNMQNEIKQIPLKINFPRC